jgi:hypothetical protein
MSRETETTRIQVTCLLCEGRGWKHNPARDRPAVRCVCALPGRKGPIFSLRKFAAMLGEDADTLARVWLLRSRPETCERVLTRLAQLSIARMPALPVEARP